MVADRTYLRGLGACYDMATVPALPDLDATLLKYLMGLHVLQQRAVSLLVGLLNSSYAAELLRQLLKNPSSSASFAMRSYISVHSAFSPSAA